MLASLTREGVGPGPLFKFKDWCFLTRQDLVGAVRESLQAEWMNPGKYGEHSFRIGVVTTVKSVERNDVRIKKTSS